MDDELKQLIEDAAKLCGYELIPNSDGEVLVKVRPGACREFAPLDPERGDLMKVADAAGIDIEFSTGWILSRNTMASSRFIKGDYQSLALAILRAASAVYKARNENAE